MIGCKVAPPHETGAALESMNGPQVVNSLERQGGTMSGSRGLPWSCRSRRRGYMQARYSWLAASCVRGVVAPGRGPHLASTKMAAQVRLGPGPLSLPACTCTQQRVEAHLLFW
jgi:hypothetical protein